MSMQPAPIDRPRAEQLAALRAQLAQARAARGPALAFGLAALDDRLTDRGLDGAGLHEIAAASSALSDDAAATLFAAGIAARFAGQPGSTVLWALTRFDLYAPGLEQVGLGPGRVLYAQGRKDSDVLALAEDGLRDGSLACVIAEIRAADAALSAPSVARALPARAAILGDDALAHRLHLVGTASLFRRRPGPLVGRADPPAERQSFFS
jgi:protein ImuA